MQWLLCRGEGTGGRGRRQREGKELQQCFFFSLSHRTCKSTCKTLSSRLRLSSVLPPCSPLPSLLSLFTHSSVPDSHTRCFCSSFIFGASPRSADYWTSDLCRDLSSPTSPPRSLSFYLLPSPVCPFPLSSRRSLPLSLCCNNSELWAVGRRAY